MRKFVLAIDQGTTSTRAVLFDQFGTLIEKAQREIQLSYPHNGWVESNALSIWISVVECINELLIKADITFDRVESIGITNQRETIVPFNKITGLPIYNAIIWQSRQSDEICDRYEDKKELIHQKTGLLINPYFSASKMLFILENVPVAKQLAAEGKLGFATIDSWILYKLTNGKSFLTDVSNASRTMLYNIKEQKYDEELLELFHIKEEMLPEVRESSSLFGKADFFKVDVPITAMMGDQQASLFGQTCFKKGDFKTTYGTGCFLLANTGSDIVYSKYGLITTVAWKRNGEIQYALEGSIFIGGAVIQWLRDNLNIISEAAESETCAREVKSTRGVYFVPAFVGLGTPYWDDDVRGTIFGLTRSSNKNHIARAALESIAYQTKDVLEVFKKETHTTPKELHVDGGAANNNYLMQFQSDICSLTILLPKYVEITALGVAYMSGLFTGYFADLDYIKNIHQTKCSFSPSMDKDTIKALYSKWKLAVHTAQKFK
ncbi:MAG: glycerol kinase GlpK [Bacilli bacterium]